MGNIVNEIGGKLEAYATYEVFNEKQDVISKAVQWLKETQHPAGYWGTRAPIETALASLALVNVGVTIDQSWPIPEANAIGGLRKAKDWLIQNRSSWFSNIWDTSLVLRALGVLGQSKESEIVQDSLIWLRNQEKSDWSHARGTGFHHPAQALITFVQFEEETSIIQSLAQWLINHQEKDGSWNHSHYTTAQVIQSLVKAGLDYRSEHINNALKWLESEISRTVLVKGVFEDFGHALIAYVQATANPESPLPQRILSDMLKSPERLKEDGSWYEDIRCTSIAIMALKTVGQRKIFRIPAVELNKILQDLDQANKIIAELDSKLIIAEESLRQRAQALPDEAIEQRVLDYLRRHDGEIYSSDVALHVGISEDYLMKVFETLQRKGKIKKIR